MRDRRRSVAQPIPLILLMVALAGVAHYLRSRGGSELAEYISPPLDTSGRRLHVLVPRGWLATITDADGPKKLPLGRHDLCWVELRPADPYSREPGWLTRITRLWRREEQTAEVSVLLATDSTWHPPAGARSAESVYHDPSAGFWLSSASLRSSDAAIVGGVGYIRDDKAAFVRTHRQVCESASVR